MLADALKVIASQWAAIVTRLTDRELLEVRRELASAAHGGSWDPNRLVGVLLEHAPEDDEAWVALERRSTRRTVSQPEMARAAAARLRWVIETTLVPSVEATDAEEVENAAQERLFTVPMMSVSPTMRFRDVLVLSHGEERLAPSFQFGADGEILADVAEINRALEADEDPWGAASWWLTPHATLHAIPSDALLLGDREQVLAVAHAAGDLP